jgi:hypothetical protein
MEIRQLEGRDYDAVGRFVVRVPEGDRTFFKEDVADPKVVTAWTELGAARSIAVDDDVVVGYVALIPLRVGRATSARFA